LTTPHQLPPLDSSLTQRLRAIALRLRGYVVLEGAAHVVAFLVACAAVQLFLDYSTRGLEWSMRAVLLGLVILGAAVMATRRLIQPLRLRIGIVEAAQLVERKNPQLATVLLSAVRFASGETGPIQSNSPLLMAAVIHRAEQLSRDNEFGAVLDPRRARRAAGLLSACLLAAAAGVLSAPEMTRIWFVRNVLLREEPWPRRTTIIVELNDGKIVGARGEDMVIRARADGVQPREVDIISRDAAGKRTRQTMVTVGSEGNYSYRYTFKAPRENFEFYVEGGDHRTETYQAVLLERPRVLDAQMHIAPPKYTRAPTFTVSGDQRAAKVLPGSEVTIRIRTNKPVIHAALVSGNDIVADAVPEGEEYTVTIAASESGTYHFQLVDDADLENVDPVRFALRVVPDEAPQVRLKLPGVGDMITSDAVLPLEVAFSDAYGLAKAELVYSVSGGASAGSDGDIPVPGFHEYLTTFSANVEWRVAEAAAQPGSVITVLARAADFDTIAGPNIAQSPAVTLRVVTRDELLAELARREQEYRMDFERLVDGQERLRGELLTVFGESARSAADSRAASLADSLVPLERRQRNISASVNVIRRQFEGILEELRINGLDTRDSRERLSGGIIAPLNLLVKRNLVEAADTIRSWARDASPETASLIDLQQGEILDAMRKTLAFMLQWEGYHEVVNMLRNIIRLQSELNEETEKSWREEAGDVFED